RIVLYGDPFWYDHGAYLTHLYTLLARADPTHRHHGYFDVANLHLYSNPTDFYWIVRQVRALLKSHGWGDKQIWISETHAKLYDHKAGIFKVVVHKPGARITVLWNQSGAGATYKLAAHAARATLHDKFGNARTIRPRGGAYVLSLPGNHDFTNPYDHRMPTV